MINKNSALRLAALAVVLFSLSLTSIKAQAGILLEPYLGYKFGSVNSTNGTSNSSPGTANSYTTNGLVYGGRLGIRVPLVFFAADYSMASGKMNGSGIDSDMTQSSLFAVAGLNLAIIRAWVGYGFMNNLTQKLGAGDVTYEGSALKAGLGFSGIPFVSINLEYIQDTFTKYTSPANGQQDISAANQISDASGKSLMFSISLPFNL